MYVALIFPGGAVKNMFKKIGSMKKYFAQQSAGILSLENLKKQKKKKKQQNLHETVILWTLGAGNRFPGDKK